MSQMKNLERQNPGNAEFQLGNLQASSRSGNERVEFLSGGVDAEFFWLSIKMPCWSLALPATQ
jgi:hypothetical protein